MPNPAFDTSDFEPLSGSKPKFDTSDFEPIGPKAAVDKSVGKPKASLAPIRTGPGYGPKPGEMTRAEELFPTGQWRDLIPQTGRDWLESGKSAAKGGWEALKGLTGLKELVSPPTTTGGKVATMLLGPAGLIGTNLVNMASAGREEMLRKEAEERANPEGSPTVARAFRSAANIPILGPFAANVGEKVGAGNIAEATAETAANIWGVPEVTARVIGKIAKPNSAPISETAKAMKESGIPVGLQDYTNEGRGGRIATNFIQNRTLGREPIFQERQRQNVAARLAIDKAAELLAPPAEPAQTGTLAASYLKAMDESALESLTKAEAERVGKLNQEAQAAAKASAAESERAATLANVEGQAAQRGRETIKADLASRRLAAQSKSLKDLDTTISGLGEIHTPEVTGQAAQLAVRQNADAFRAQARQMYSKVDEMAEGIPVLISPIKDFFANLEQDLSGFAGKTAKLKGADVDKILADAREWKEAPNTVSFSEASDLLSALKSIGRESRDLINSRYPGAIKRMTDTLQSQMSKSASAIRKPEAMAAYESANKFYRENVTLFNDSTVADLMRKPPEAISAALWKPNNVTMTREMQQALKGQPEAWAALQRRGLQDLVEKSMDHGELNTAKLKQNWTALGPDMQGMLAGPQQNMLDAKIRQADAVGGPLREVTTPTLEKPPKFKPEEPTPYQEPKPIKPEPQHLALNSQERSVRIQLKTEPDNLAAKILDPDSGEFALEVKRSLQGSPELLAQTRRQAFERMVKDNTGLPVAGGEPVLNTRGIAKAWESLPLTTRSFIAGDKLNELNRLMKAMEGMDLKKIQTLHHAVYGGMIDPFIIGSSMSAALAGFLSHGAEGAGIGSGATAALALIGPRYIGRALTNPKMVKWLTEGLELRPGSQEAARWAARAGSFGLVPQSKAAPTPQLTPPQ